MSDIDTLCRAVRDALNNAPAGTYHGLYQNWVSKCPATWQHVPQFDRKDIEILRVIVSADPEESHQFASDLVDQCCAYPIDHTVFVGVIKRLESQDDYYLETTDVDELEALKTLSEDVAKYLYPLRINGQTPIRIGFTPFYDRELVTEERTYRSIVSIRYR